MIKGLEDEIIFDEPNHTYTHRVTGKGYLPVSKFIALFSKDVNWSMVASATAKSKGVSKSDVEDDWTRRADNGTRIHKAIEKYEQSTVVHPSNEDIRPIITTVAGLYTGYYRLYQEQRLRDDDHFICGTTDKLAQCTSSSKSVLDIDDYKTKEDKLVKYKSDSGTTYMLHCLSHLQDCTYIKNAIQLSIYAYMAEKLSGRRIGMLNIVEIPTFDHTQIRRIPVPYMKHEVIAMLSWYRENVLNKQQAPVVDLFDDNFIFGE